MKLKIWPQVITTHPRNVRTLVGVGVVFTSVCLAAVPLFGYSTGNTMSCSTCHTPAAGSAPTVSISGVPSYMELGQSDTTVYVNLTRNSASHVRAGFWLNANRGAISDSFADISSSGLNSYHNTPRVLSSGSTQFRVTYTAPTSLSASTATLQAWTLASNGNGLPSGDHPRLAASVVISLCEDADGDGHYRSGSGPNCPRTNAQWDCNDTSSSMYPGRPEICDNVDNDCDGSIDEGCDDDDDNHCDAGLLKRGNLIVSTCSSTPISATVGDDCRDSNANVRPGAIEFCDGIDNDCDGLADEGC